MRGTREERKQRRRCPRSGWPLMFLQYQSGKPGGKPASMSLSLEGADWFAAREVTVLAWLSSWLFSAYRRCQKFVGASAVSGSMRVGAFFCCWSLPDMTTLRLFMFLVRAHRHGQVRIAPFVRAIPRRISSSKASTTGLSIPPSKSRPSRHHGSAVFKCRRSPNSDLLREPRQFTSSRVCRQRAPFFA